MLLAACTQQREREIEGFLEEGSDLRPYQMVNGTLEVKTPQSYKINLDSGTYVYGIVDQLSVDAALKILSPSGKELVKFDGPASGHEVFFFDTGEAGLHVIEVAPFKEDSGNYSIVIKRIEAIAEVPEERVGQLLAPFDDPEVPGAAVGVYHDGALVYKKGFGSANLTYNIPFTSVTPTNIGSVSKQFTATAILLLEQEGKLSLDDDVRKHIPELKDFGHSITIRNLLNHMSGYREIYNTLPIIGWDGESFLQRDEAINLVNKQPSLQVEPGSEFNYNNTGYILLAETVARVSGISFPEFMRQNIFEPLEMNNTQVRTDPREIIPKSSMGYQNQDYGYGEVGDLFAAYGAGSIYTTIEDFGKWLQNFKTGKIGGLELITKLTTRGITTKGDTLDYALGIGVGEYRGQKRFQHTGGDIAHRAILIYYPEIDAGLAIASNNASFPLNVSTKIADLFFGDYFDKAGETQLDSGEVEVSRELLETYAGKYKFDNSGLIITYILEDDGFFAQAMGQNRLKMKGKNDSSFAYEGIEASVVFYRDEEGIVSSATHIQGGENTMTRLPPYDPTPEQLAEFAGKFFSEELETMYEISVKDSILVARHLLMEDISLTPAEEDSFSGSVYFINELKFERDSNGKVLGFNVSNGRTKGVKFGKMRE